MKEKEQNKLHVELSRSYDTLYFDVCSIIERACEQAYRAINVSLTLRNWQLGERIAREKLDGKERAGYGKQLMDNLAKELTDTYGKGFDRISLYNYLKFYRYFPKIVDAVSQQSEKVGAASQQFKVGETLSTKLLPWTHYRELIRVDNTQARKWYEQEALHEMWSTRTLHRNIASQYYSRLLQSVHKEKVAEEMHKLTAPMQQDRLEFLKNPVVAEFLGLQSNSDTSDDMARYSVLHGSKQIFQAKLPIYQQRTN